VNRGRPLSRAGLSSRLRARFRLQCGVSLAPYTRLAIGGAAEWLFRPESVFEVSAFLAQSPSGVDVTPIGLGSNLLVRDGGVEGLVVRLNEAARGVAIDGCDIVAGADVANRVVCGIAQRNGLCGLEFLDGHSGRDWP
jgi:UDP-N-acetylmuramate dehydrogenase